jgi:hypothetical protein
MHWYSNNKDILDSLRQVRESRWSEVQIAFHHDISNSSAWCNLG